MFERKLKMARIKGKLFCEINPACYAISEEKEIIKRHFKNIVAKKKYSKKITAEKFPIIISKKEVNLIKKGKGIDPILQKNKRENIIIACKSINGLIIHPGEIFSFWKRIGKTTKRKGYKDGRVINKNKIEPGRGGGLCNLANTINWLVLHSPLDIIELHHHSDSLSPVKGDRIPFSSGTSVNYNYIDYQFKNNTDQSFQMLFWVENDKLYGELRSLKEFPYEYELVEEDHHFKKSNDKYYHKSKIYRLIKDKNGEEETKKELILDNKSLVMYDYDLIPEEEIVY